MKKSAHVDLCTSFLLFDLAYFIIELNLVKFEKGNFCRDGHRKVYKPSDYLIILFKSCTIQNAYIQKILQSQPTRMRNLSSLHKILGSNFIIHQYTKKKKRKFSKALFFGPFRSTSKAVSSLLLSLCLFPCFVFFVICVVYVFGQLVSCFFGVLNNVFLWFYAK